MALKPSKNPKTPNFKFPVFFQHKSCKKNQIKRFIPVHPKFPPFFSRWISTGRFLRVEVWFGKNAMDSCCCYKRCSNTYKKSRHVLGSLGSIWNVHHKNVFLVTSRTTKTIPKPETKSQSMWSFKTNAFGSLYLKSPWDPPEKKSRGAMKGSIVYPKAGENT